MCIQTVKTSIVIRKRLMEIALSYPLIHVATTKVYQMLNFGHELLSTSITQNRSNPCCYLLIVLTFHLMHKARGVVIDERFCFVGVGQTMQKFNLIFGKPFAHTAFSDEDVV